MPQNTFMRINSDSTKVDSVFAAYFEALNDFAEGQFESSPVERINAAAAFLEFISGIESQRKGTRFGKIYMHEGALKEDLEKWKAWYKKNRSKLTWDNETNRVVFVENQ